MQLCGDALDPGYYGWREGLGMNIDREIRNGEIYINGVHLGRLTATPEQLLNRIRYLRRATSGFPCLATPAARIVWSLNAGRKAMTVAEWALEMGINLE